MKKQKNLTSDSSSEQESNEIMKNPSDKLEFTRNFGNVTNPILFEKVIDDGIAFQKYASDYIKNILFKDIKLNFSEGVDFDFHDFTKIFTKSFSLAQHSLFYEIIGLKYPKENEQYSSGDFDLIFNGIKGEDITKIMKLYPSNILKSNKTPLDNNLTYNIIFKIKKSYMNQLKYKDNRKQLTKYCKIINLLSLEPELKEIKNKLNIFNTNKLIFAMVTNGDYKYYVNNKLLIDKKKISKMSIFWIMKAKQI